MSAKPGNERSRTEKPRSENARTESARSQNVVWSVGHVPRGDREALLGHRPATLWFTGLSGSGKSTLANAVERELVDRGVHAYVLDGDNIRHGLSGDLGFAADDRTENIRRIGEVAKLFNDAGVLVLTAFISPYRSDRDRVRATLPEGEFAEVFVDCPLETCEARDVKGLYARARAGEIPDFTGISAPYEAPLAAEIRVPTAELSLALSVRRVLTWLEQSALIPRRG